MPVISARFIWASIVGRFCETPTQEPEDRSPGTAALQLQNRLALRRCDHDSSQDSTLSIDQLSDTFASERQHFIQLRAGKCRFFSGTLNFNKLAVFSRHKIEIHTHKLVLFIIQVEDRLSFQNPGTYCGDELLHWRCVDFFFASKFPAGD